MDELVRHIIGQLVNNPQDLEVTSSESNGAVRIVVSVLPEEAGLVIGRRGYVIRAIRQLCNVIAVKQKKRVIVDVIPIGQEN